MPKTDPMPKIVCPICGGVNGHKWNCTLQRLGGLFHWRTT
jgi:hypothetical protein